MSRTVRFATQIAPLVWQDDRYYDPGSTMAKQNKVLFLCTGNYYRSRFAEGLFNSLAPRAWINWVADSRALNISAGRNVGPISRYALDGLRERGIELGENVRFPQQVTEEDLSSAALIIAMKEKEHRPLIEAAFPQWAHRVEFWHVHDLDLYTAAQALPEIERLVNGLLARLLAMQDSAA